MINEDPNMGRKQIFSELPLPSKVEEKGISNLIYKGIFIIVKLLLDIRLNLVKISEGKPIKTKYQEHRHTSEKPITKKPDNPIRGLDNITVEEKSVQEPKATSDPIAKNIKVDQTKKAEFKEGSVNKGGVNDRPTTPRPEVPPQGSTPKNDEKSDEAVNDTDKPSEEK